MNVHDRDPFTAGALRPLRAFVVAAFVAALATGCTFPFDAVIVRGMDATADGADAQPTDAGPRDVHVTEGGDASRFDADAMDDGPFDGGLDATIPDDGPVADAGNDLDANDAADVDDVPVAMDEGCSGAEVFCNGACVDLQSDSSHCGGCNTTCPAVVANGGSMCMNGQCVLACAAGFGDCNGLTVDGCETPTSWNRDHCSVCGMACDPTGSNLQYCSLGACQSCADGYADCDGDGLNGCEVNIASDVQNCGACNFPCPSGMLCSGSACVCPPGLMACGGVCVDAAHDPSNCGSCGNVCAAGWMCDAGTCAQSCTSTQDCLPLTCIDTMSDRLHCGSCSNACTGTQFCSGGMCVECGNIC